MIDAPTRALPRLAGQAESRLLDLAKLEPALSRHPSGRISNHARVFAPVTRTVFGNNLKTFTFMKPTPQISSRRSASFPVTDYQYQPRFDAACAGVKETPVAPRLHGFWKLGTIFHGAESHRHDAADFLVFTLMGISCAWPIVSVGMAIVRVFYG